MKEKLALFTPLVNDAVGHLLAKDFQYNIHALHLQARGIRLTGRTSYTSTHEINSPFICAKRALLHTYTNFLNKTITIDTSFSMFAQQLIDSGYDMVN